MGKLSFWGTWNGKSTGEKGVLRGLVWNILSARVEGQEWVIIPDGWLAEQAALILVFPAFEHTSV